MHKYEKLGVVGEGVYGVVVKGKHKESGEVVAIKKFKEIEGEEEVSKKITLREVKILKSLQHENIVEFKEAFRRKGMVYAVFEFVEKSVMDLLEENPNGLERETVRLLTCQLAKALEHCHRCGVVHRDVKPENLLVDPSDNLLRLCDFGCARKLKGDDQLTDYIATRWYRAPELLLGSTSYGKGVDMWALGCLLGELADGQPLFAGKSDTDQLAVIQKILGTLKKEDMEDCLETGELEKLSFPEVEKPVTLEARYNGKMSEPQLQVLKRVLQMDPLKRFTAKAALKMPWFDGVKLPKSKRSPPPAAATEVTAAGTAAAKGSEAAKAEKTSSAVTEMASEPQQADAANTAAKADIGSEEQSGHRRRKKQEAKPKHSRKKGITEQRHADNDFDEASEVSEPLSRTVSVLSSLPLTRTLSVHKDVDQSHQLLQRGTSEADKWKIPPLAGPSKKAAQPQQLVRPGGFLPELVPRQPKGNPAGDSERLEKSNRGVSPLTSLRMTPDGGQNMDSADALQRGMDGRGRQYVLPWEVAS
mmetsp:Transcript_52611/g.125671  ORF Transcript_52611/g.125671 Transcript_52611/m.125671 type:complete len:531 (-) Transcript_52611:229-1821(-)